MKNKIAQLCLLCLLFNFGVVASVVTFQFQDANGNPQANMKGMIYPESPLVPNGSGFLTSKQIVPFTTDSTGAYTDANMQAGLFYARLLTQPNSYWEIQVPDDNLSYYAWQLSPYLNTNLTLTIIPVASNTNALLAMQVATHVYLTNIFNTNGTGQVVIPGTNTVIVVNGQQVSVNVPTTAFDATGAALGAAQAATNQLNIDVQAELAALNATYNALTNNILPKSALNLSTNLSVDLVPLTTGGAPFFLVATFDGSSWSNHAVNVFSNAFEIVVPGHGAYSTVSIWNTNANANQESIHGENFTNMQGWVAWKMDDTDGLDQRGTGKLYYVNLWSDGTAWFRDIRYLWHIVNNSDYSVEAYKGHIILDYPTSAQRNLILPCVTNLGFQRGFNYLGMCASNGIWANDSDEVVVMNGGTYPLKIYSTNHNAILGGGNTRDNISRTNCFLMPGLTVRFISDGTNYWEQGGDSVLEGGDGGSGDGEYVTNLNPNSCFQAFSLIPSSMLPQGSASVSGIFKVDNTTIKVTGGALTVVGGGGSGGGSNLYLAFSNNTANAVNTLWTNSTGGPVVYTISGYGISANSTGAVDLDLVQTNNDGSGWHTNQAMRMSTGVVASNWFSWTVSIPTNGGWAVSNYSGASATVAILTSQTTALLGAGQAGVATANGNSTNQTLYSATNANTIYNQSTNGFLGVTGAVPGFGLETWITNFFIPAAAGNTAFLLYTNTDGVGRQGGMAGTFTITAVCITNMQNPAGTITNQYQNISQITANNSSVGGAMSVNRQTISTAPPEANTGMTMAITANNSGNQAGCWGVTGTTGSAGTNSYWITAFWQPQVNQMR